MEREGLCVRQVEVGGEVVVMLGKVDGGGVEEVFKEGVVEIEVGMVGNDWSCVKCSVW